MRANRKEGERHARSNGFIASTVKSAESPTRTNITGLWELRELRPDDFVLEPLVVSFLIIVFNELRDCFAQWRFANRIKRVSFVLFKISIKEGRAVQPPRAWPWSSTLALTRNDPGVRTRSDPPR